MQDPAITEFIIARKDEWRKQKIKSGMSDDEIAQKIQECEEKFALVNWLPDAAKRAGQITMSTHPCTFSHPSARKNKNGYVSSVIAKNSQRSDGFLHSGNVNFKTNLLKNADALGNAAALDVYEFLSLKMQDGETLLSHIEQETELAKALLTQPNQSYEALRDGFLQMVKISDENITSSKVKQVYYYIEEEESYHLLSILTHSGLVFELRKRLDNLRFSKEVKKARDCRKNNEFHQTGYKEIFDLTTIGYGGTKPQNVSVLNNKNGGKALLLLSAPPSLKSRDVRVPTTNFFAQSFTPWQGKFVFKAFHRILTRNQNNLELREKRDEIIQEYMDLLLQKMWQLRNFFENYQSELPELLNSQNIWLFPQHQTTRMETDDWIDEILTDISRNFLTGYKTVLGDKAVKLSDIEMLAIKEVIKQNQEALR